MYGWMDERMNGRVAFLLFDRLATADLASRNRWELGAERGGEGGLNYGWMDDVGGGGEGCLARARAPLTGKLLFGGVT